MQKGLKEIQNMKNTCYINSVIHLVSHIHPLKKVLCSSFDSEMIDEDLM